MKDEHGESFDCFGGTCAVYVIGEHADRAVAHAKHRLLAWHDQFTRFDPASELSRLNADPRPAVPVSYLLARLAQTAVGAAELTGGLVDATLLGELEQAGYRGDLGAPVPLADALRRAPARSRAAGRPGEPWRALSVDGRIVRRPPGLKLDGGGLAKGLFADVLAGELTRYRGFAIDCAGDLRVAGPARAVHVASPFDGTTLHTFRIADGAVATSGIGRRSWIDGAGRPAHHLLDPSTGRPAFTGIVQVTAVAPTAVEAEIRAKAALLSGPERAHAWLRHGGVLVFDDGGYRIRSAVTSSARSANRRGSRPLSSRTLLRR
jgi:thiamine biosynthesis lipoprotein